MYDNTCAEDTAGFIPGLLKIDAVLYLIRD
jgi:hypothetical protein